MHKIKIYLSFASYFCPSSCCELFAEGQIQLFDLLAQERNWLFHFIQYPQHLIQRTCLCIGFLHHK